MHVTPVNVAQLTRIWNKDGDAPVIILRCFYIIVSGAVLRTGADLSSSPSPDMRR